MADSSGEIQHESTIERTSKPLGSYAFLNHSSITLPNNLPPNVDDRSLARHKRKRTSPEDQAILEAAFASDSKPDRTARLELVKQVALGEKEVQIWFQNRRQTSRRKSRPLLPHEIVQYQLSRTGWDYGTDQSDPDRVREFDGATKVAPINDERFKLMSENPTEITVRGSNAGVRTTVKASSNCPTPSQASAEADNLTPRQLPSSQSFRSYNHTVNSSMTPSESNGSAGSLSYRRSAPSLRNNLGRSMEGPQNEMQCIPAHNLRKSSSVVRLTLSSDGNAQISTKDASSPSPPRVPQTMQLSLHGNVNKPQSPIVSAHAHSVPLFQPLQRTSSGRSRDSRAWEFWCDKDARTELEGKAEKDASGSAADAIDLLRSTSGRKILGTLPSKRNSLTHRASTSSKRARFEAKPSLLQRSSTFSGRPHNKSLISAKSMLSPSRKLKDSESALGLHIPGNDSDKENWSPESNEQPEVHELGETVSFERLSEHSTARTHDRRAFLTKTNGSSLSNSESGDPEADPELAAFMHGEGTRNHISQEEELDCVQNLLSLSQGNWR